MKTYMLIALVALYGCGETPASPAPTTAAEEPKPAEEKKPAAETKKEEAKQTETVSTETQQTETLPTETLPTETLAFKLTADNCIDPDLTKLFKGTTLMLCDGTIAEGSYEAPAAPVMPDLTNLVASNIKKDVVINGVTGTYEATAPSCPAAPDLTNLTAANVKSGITIHDVTGTFSCPAEPDLTNLVAANVKSGTVINGVTGSYDNRPVDCSGFDEVGCVTTASKLVKDLTNLTAANVKNAVVIAGVTGSYDNRPATCSSNAEVGCVTDATYKAADLTNLSVGNIKSGVAIAGVTGQFPSATYKLTGADNTADLTDATFDAKAKSATDFEWFDAEGSRYVYQGDADLATASNLKNGVTIFGMLGDFVGTPVEPAAKDLRAGVTAGTVTGTLKASCRNGSRLALFDGPYPPTNNADGGADNATVNWWDTLDDYNNGFGSLPAEFNAVLWTSNNICNGTTFTRDTTITSGTQDAYKDDISGLTWSYELTPAATTYDWTNAVQQCFGWGGGGWRLPTQKELMDGYNHGLSRVAALANSPFYSGHENSFFWTATSKSDALTSAWTVNPATGEVKAQAKTVGLHVLCVK